MMIIKMNWYHNLVINVQDEVDVIWPVIMYKVYLNSLKFYGCETIY